MTQIVEVVWDDAHVTTGETTVKKADKVKPVRTRTVAYLVSENDEGLVLASDAYDKKPKEFRVWTFIPWGMVIEYWKLD